MCTDEHQREQTAINGAEAPVLAELWDNEADAAYDGGAPEVELRWWERGRQ